MTRTLLCAALAAGWIAPLSAGAIEVQRQYHESFEVGEGAALLLAHGDGDVAITVWDRDVVDVEVRYHAVVTRVGSGETPEFQVAVSQEGDRVRVTGRETGQSMVGVFLSWDVREHRYTIRVPRHASVTTRGQDGDVSIVDVAGKIDVQLQDGDVRVDLGPGSLPDLEVGVQDGDVELRLGEGISCAFLVTCEDGRVEVNAPEARRLVRDEGRVYGEIGDAQGKVRIRARDGDVRIAGP